MIEQESRQRKEREKFASFSLPVSNIRRIRAGKGEESMNIRESTPEVLTQAMGISWTQNVVILEAELTIQERAWYIRAAQRFGWSKLGLQRQIAAGAYKGNTLDFEGKMCCTEKNFDSMECVEDDKSAFRLPREYLPQPKWPCGALTLEGGQWTRICFLRRRRSRWTLRCVLCFIPIEGGTRIM